MKTRNTCKIKYYTAMIGQIDLEDLNLSKLEIALYIKMTFIMYFHQFQDYS